MTALKAGIRDGLAAFLRTQLGTAFPTLIVNAFWPQPGQPLGDYTLAITSPGTPEFEFHAPLIESVTPGITPAGTATFTYGNVSVGMQLDAFTKTEATRDDLIDALDRVLNQPAVTTLNVTTLFPMLEGDGGLVIVIPELLGMTFDFNFDVTATLYDDSDSVQQGEWRATWTGTADGYVATQQQVVLLQRIGIPITP